MVLQLDHVISSLPRKGWRLLGFSDFQLRFAKPYSLLYMVGNFGLCYGGLFLISWFVEYLGFFFLGILMGIFWSSKWRWWCYKNGNEGSNFSLPRQSEMRKYVLYLLCSRSLRICGSHQYVRHMCFEGLAIYTQNRTCNFLCVREGKCWVIIFSTTFTTTYSHGNLWVVE